jgi:hypothetical protein
LLLLQAARLAASKIAVRAKVGLLLFATVDVDVGGGGVGTGVGGADDDDGEIDDVRILVDSFGTSLSDKLFRLRAKVDCEINEGSVNGSVEGSESDRERDCLSVFVINCFRAEERSRIEIESVDTNGRSVDDEVR